MTQCSFSNFFILINETNKIITVHLRQSLFTSLVHMYNLTMMDDLVQCYFKSYIFQIYLCQFIPHLLQRFKKNACPDIVHLFYSLRNFLKTKTSINNNNNHHH